MELKEIREHISSIDEGMLKLFLERMGLAGEVAKVKAETGKPILDRAREREILKWATEESGGFSLYSHRFFSMLLELSRAYQAKLLAGKSEMAERIRTAVQNAPAVFPKEGVVACQGVEGAYAQIACDRLFPRGSVLFLRSFEAVFDAVESGLCEFGVLPIENSSNGSVRAVYDLMQRKRFYIVKSVKLWVRHALLAKPGLTMSDVKVVYSHEQALGQCGDFLKSLGDSVKVIPCANTAIAAQMAANAKEEGGAAISSPHCAELYGLNVLNDSIQNSENNSTRFICIAKQPVIYPGANKISLMLSCAHRPGALAELMSAFSATGVNISKLESTPIVGHDFEFMFFFDIEASVLEEGVVGMLEELEHSCDTFLFLGCYSEL